MPTKVMKTVSDTFFTTLLCSDERRFFNTDRQRAMFKKLHYKKCETCGNAPKVDLGMNQTSFNDGVASSYMDSRERMMLQEEIVRAFY